MVVKEQFSESTNKIHFTIYLDENSSSYSCQLVRRPCTSDSGRCADGFTYRLYVDQTPIMEHAVDAALRVGVPEELYSGTAAESTADGPPSYDETVDDADNQLPPYDA